jgi:hypothetical protein
VGLAFKELLLLCGVNDWMSMRRFNCPSSWRTFHHLTNLDSLKECMPMPKEPV